MARVLPDEFRLLTGSPLDRLVAMVNHHWPAYEARGRAELVEALLPAFRKIGERDGDVTDHHRRCEAVVAVWLKRQ